MGAAVMTANPCTTCGACCAHYRVAFHWLELEAAPVAALPQAMLVQLDGHRVALRGTEGGRSPRCCALEGEIGRDVYCRVYAQRPSPCREVQPDGLDGRPNEQCRKARAHFGLPPLPAGVTVAATRTPVPVSEPALSQPRQNDEGRASSEDAAIADAPHLADA